MKKYERDDFISFSHPHRRDRTHRKDDTGVSEKHNNEVLKKTIAHGTKLGMVTGIFRGAHDEASLVLCRADSVTTRWIISHMFPKSQTCPFTFAHSTMKCFCGESTANYARLGMSTQCNMPCGGDTTETCGGNTVMSVYGVNDASIIGEKHPLFVGTASSGTA